MAESTTHKVLVVVSDPARAEALGRALAHPSLSVDAAGQEQEILTAFRQQRFDLAIVAGHLGRRSPLVAGEAVRLRQEGLPVLIVVGRETPADELAAHRDRRLDGVVYLEVGDGWQPAVEGYPTEAASRIRTTVLERFGAAEDQESVNVWLAREQEATEQARAVPPEPEPAPIEAEVIEDEATVIEAPPEPPPPPRPAVAGPPQPIGEDDVSFAARLVEQSRNVDFRQAPAPSRAPEGTGAERTVHLLREKLREHERNIARLAHVYAARLATFEASDAQIAEVENARHSLETDLERLRQHMSEEREHARSDRGEREIQITALEKGQQQLEARVQELQSENSRLHTEMEQREQGRLEQERGFGTMLKQAQDAFAALRDHSSRAFADYEQKITQQQAETAQARDQITTAEGRLEQGRLAVEAAERERRDLMGRIDALERQALEQEQIREQERIKARAEQADAVETLLREKAAIEARIAELHQQIAAGQMAMTELRQQAESPLGEIERLQRALAESEQKIAAERQQATAAQAAADAKWLERFDTVKKAIVELKGNHEKSLTTLRERDEKLAVTEAKLHARDEEVDELQKANREVSEALTRERVGFAEALDAKLDALERFARETSERMVRLVEALAQLDQVARRQEVLTERLLKRAPVPSLPPAGGSTSPEAAPSLMDRLTRREKMWAGGIAGGFLLLLLIVGLWPSSPAPTGAVAPPAPTSVEAAEPEGEPAPTANAPEAAAEPETTPAEPEAAPEEAAAPEAETPTETPEPEAAAEPAPQEAAEPEAAAEPEPAPSAEPDLIAKSPAGPAPDKRELRRDLFDSYRAKKYAKAVAAGNQLRDAYGIDWEAEYTLARAQERAGYAKAAAATYLHFADTYSQNKFADGSRLTAAKLLATSGDKKKAREVLEKLAADPKSDARAAAAKELKKLGR